MCQNFRNWPIISVNDHFSVSEFSQKSRSFEVSCSWSTQGLKWYDVSSQRGRPVSLFQIRFVFSHEHFFIQRTTTYSNRKPIGGSGPNVCIGFTRLPRCVLCNPPRVRTGNKWGETDSAYCSVHKGLQHPHAHTCVLCPKQRATLNVVCTLLLHTI